MTADSQSVHEKTWVRTHVCLNPGLSHGSLPHLVVHSSLGPTASSLGGVLGQPPHAHLFPHL